MIFLSRWRAGNRTLWSHLGLEPGLQVFAVLGSDGLVVLSDSGEDGGQVLLRSGVHLHVHLPAHVGPQSEQVL